jgi:hypothetical protein
MDINLKLARIKRNIKIKTKIGLSKTFKRINFARNQNSKARIWCFKK